MDVFRTQYIYIYINLFYIFFIIFQNRENRIEREGKTWSDVDVPRGTIRKNRAHKTICLILEFLHTLQPFKIKLHSIKINK